MKTNILEWICSYRVSRTMESIECQVFQFIARPLGVDRMPALVPIRSQDTINRLDLGEFRMKDPPITGVIK